MWSSDFSDPNPPLTEDVRQEVEKLLGVALPDSYVTLMRERNGGNLEEQLVLFDGKIPEGMEYYVGDGYISIGAIFGINPNPNAMGSITQTTYMTKEWGLPDGLVLLDGDGHIWIALDYRQIKDNPPVIYLVSDTGQYITIADSFAEFLKKMVPFESVYDEDGEFRK